MRKIIWSVLLFVLFIPTFVMASNKKVVDVIYISTDYAVSRYQETKIVIELKDSEENVFKNVYSKQQIQRSNADDSYIVEGSNCIYLSDVDYKAVKDDMNVTFWFWFIFLSILCVVVWSFSR